MAEGAYVYHVEQASRGSLKGKKEIYSKNQQIYEKRWGKLLRILFITGSVKDKSGFQELYEMSKGMARQRAIVDMWASNDLKKEVSLEGNDIVKHADVGIRLIPKGALPYNILWKVLTKKKKYDAVIINEGSISSILKALNPLHRSQIFPREDHYIRTLDGEYFDLKKPYVLAKELRKEK